MCAPLRATTSDSNVRSVAERPRTLVKSAILPPGVRTAVVIGALAALERVQGLLEEVKCSEAADRVEALVAEGQRLGVAAHEGDLFEARVARVADRLGEHRLGHVDAHDEAVGADRAAEVAAEIAGSAGYVEHPVAG